MANRENKCDAVTRTHARCKRRATQTIPNTLSGIGIGQSDWKYGKSVKLCAQHSKIFHKKHIQPLIKNGFLQAYNQYHYGSIVLTEIIDWANPPTECTVPKFWSQEENPAIKM